MVFSGESLGAGEVTALSTACCLTVAVLFSVVHEGDNSGKIVFSEAGGQIHFFF